MTITRSDMVQAGKDAISSQVQYIYGAKPAGRGTWKLYTLAQIRALRGMYGSDMVWPSDDAKAGRPCCDCSGLVQYATGWTLNSSGLYAAAVERASIDKVEASPSYYAGWVLWKSGHVGIVSDTPGYAYELGGSASNACHRSLSAVPWVYALRIPGIDYGPVSQAAPTDKSTDVLAGEVIAGLWGVGQDRRDRLTVAGYDYATVQARVNAILRGTAPATGGTAPATGGKTVDQLATEVITGLWGVGQDRRDRLTNAGYDYSAVQAEVNRRLL